jgi:phenylalanyl-tRNA synthetase beta subunit
VGRVYGYSHIEATPLPEPQEKPKVNKRFYYAEKIRRVLSEQGFSEVYTYALQPKGEVELANALAADKPFLRSTLVDGLKASLEQNVRNADFLGLEQVRIFEIGTVFENEGEHVSLALGVKNAKKMKHGESEVLRKAVEELATHLEVSLPSGKDDGEVWEINFTELLEKLPEPDVYDISYNFDESKEVKFQPVSQYPFVLRDIALWVSKGTTSDEVLGVIKENAGELLMKCRLFDEFEKDERVSYAFRLVFQSYGRTLTDEEVNLCMEQVYAAVKQKGWEVR